MRLIPELLILSIIVCGFTVQPTSIFKPASTQGLYWGILEQQEINYYIENIFWDENGSFDSDTYKLAAMVYQTGSIPDDIETINQIPYPELLWFYRNGTAFDYNSEITYHLATRFGLPIGNWTLLTILHSTGNSFVVQSDTEWLFSYKGEVHMRCPGRECHYNFTETISYRKSDGVLIRDMFEGTVFNSSELLFVRFIQRDHTTHNTTTSSTAITQTNTPTNSDWSQVILFLILIPSCAAISGVLIAYVYITRSIMENNRS